MLLVALAATEIVRVAKGASAVDETLVDEFTQRQVPEFHELARGANQNGGQRDITLPVTSADNGALLRRVRRLFGSSPSASTLKVFGVGLSRTGTSSLAEALRSLGLRVLHFDDDCTPYLYGAAGDRPDMRGRYDEVDAVVDLPSAMYYRELAAAYPNALFVSTWRDPEEWFDSFERYLNETSALYAPASFPFTIRRLHATVYGSETPQRALWIDHYNRHYQDAGRALRSAGRPVLHLTLSGGKVHLQPPRNGTCGDCGCCDDCMGLCTCLPCFNSTGSECLCIIPTHNHKIMAGLCEFIGLTPGECPDAEYPHAYSLRSVRDELARSDRTGLISHHAFDIRRRDAAAQAQSRFAYVTLVADASANDFKGQFVLAAAVWCRSVRASYPDGGGDFDMVALVLNRTTADQRALLQLCFDRLVPIAEFGRSPDGVRDSRYYALVRAKLWSFALTEYQRIIFMDADQLVIRNIDHYFLRNKTHKTVLPGDKDDDEDGASFYATVSNHAPINSGFFVASPSRQTVIDLATLFRLGRWNKESGWMGAGRFSWSPKPLSVAPPFPMWDGRDRDFPFLPLIPHPARHELAWTDASWSFYCSWADQGALFWYFYILNPTQGGIIDADDLDHEVIHFIGVHKPWIEDDGSAAYGRAFQWRPAFAMWRRHARQLLLDAGELHAAEATRHRRASASTAVQELFDRFHRNVNAARKPAINAQLQNLDPYKSTDANLGSFAARYCKFVPPFTGDVLQYACSVPYAYDNSTVLTARPHNAHAAIASETHPVGDIFPLDVGQNVVVVVVKAQAGNEQAYTLTITRRNETLPLPLHLIPVGSSKSTQLVP